VKKTFFRAALAAGVLATWWLTLPVEAQAPPGPAAQRPVGTSVAVIDISYVFKNFGRFNAQMADIKKDIEAYEGQLRDRQTKIAKDGEKLKEFNAGSPEYKRLEEQIASAQAELQVDMQLKRKQFLEAEARVYYNAYTEIVDQVAQFAERNGIGLVLRFTGEQIDPQKRETVLQGVNRAVVYQRHLNITDLILERLNRGSVPNNQVGNTPHLQIPQRVNR
jgi:Skp family chaperone for outer membrane proteins